MMFNNVNAQTVNQGDQIINVGLGVDPFYSFSSYNGASKKSFGPIVAGYEYIVTEKLGIGRIGVGGIIRQSFYSQKYNSNYYSSFNDKASRTAIIARAAYHFDLPVKGLDLYAGVGAGFYFHNRKSTYTTYSGINSESSDVSVAPGHYIFGGVRYFFTEGFGVYGEFGHGLNALSLGLVFKF